MADLVKRAMKQCPDTKVVMSGYSQGGQLVHNAAAMLESEVSKEMGAGMFLFLFLSFFFCNRCSSRFVLCFLEEDRTRRQI